MQFAARSQPERKSHVATRGDEVTRPASRRCASFVASHRVASPALNPLSTSFFPSCFLDFPEGHGRSFHLRSSIFRNIAEISVVFLRVINNFSTRIRRSQVFIALTFPPFPSHPVVAIGSVPQGNTSTLLTWPSGPRSGKFAGFWYDRIHYSFIEFRSLVRLYSSSSLQLGNSVAFAYLPYVFRFYTFPSAKFLSSIIRRHGRLIMYDQINVSGVVWH